MRRLKIVFGILLTLVSIVSLRNILSNLLVERRGASFLLLVVFFGLAILGMMIFKNNRRSE